MKKLHITLSTALVAALLMPLQATAKPTTLKDSRDNRDTYAPYNKDNFPNNVYFGDTHLHTSYSTDAALFGATIGPDAAYRFAKGEVVTSSTGKKTRLERPLDFLVVADHAENLGLAPLMTSEDPMVMNNPWGKKITQLYKKGDLAKAYAMWGGQVTKGEDPFADNVQMAKTMWGRLIDAAEAHNEPGKFTALIGFEWTSSPGGSNLHRNVIFKDGGDVARKVLPYSVYDSENPEDLWKYMAKIEKEAGAHVFAIPHNGNLSNGLMFDDVRYDNKKPIDAAYAKERMKREPIYEVTQMKGDGEAHPSLSPNDEFADYAKWDKGSFSAAKEKGMIEKEYAREAYKRGLQYEAKLGVNPFKFGLVGSTDSHTALATTTENNFFGKVSEVEPGMPKRFTEMVTGFLPDPKGRDYAIYARHTSSSGLAAVWARENTRSALWDAMVRKEVYATTGTRMKVRVFAGWDFIPEDLTRPDFAHNGYLHGVPMGGDLSGDAKAKSPKFLIKAWRDADWANLDRIQVIKGWTDAQGKAHEKIYDVAVSDGRKIENGRCKTPVGSTVNEKEAFFDNSIGAPMLQTFWEDPQFDATQRAFYYVRVLEIPTPRWTTYDAKYFKVKRPEDVPVSIQERAYTSPIWYSPAGK
jgi:hypothetical protein